MDSEKIDLTFLLAAVLLILLLEVIAAGISAKTDIPPLLLLGCIRLLQVISLFFLAGKKSAGAAVLGLDRENLVSGLKTGLIWSAAFAGVAAAGFSLLFLSGENPLLMIRTPIPRDGKTLFLFFAVGGIIAPIAEELFFRGIVYGYLRRYGIATAVIASTLIFTVFHTSAIVPVTQIIGGIVFALSYEYGKNLVAPITIHVLGNLSIFSLSLLS